jgi:AraC-like DNA-binding protein
LRARWAVTIGLAELARALAGEISFGELTKRHGKLGRRFFLGRLHSDMASLASGLVDPVAHGFWSANFRKWDREVLGLSRLPTLVISVAPAADRDRDALEALVSARRFAHACSDVAFELDDTICGRTGGGIVYLLTHVDPTPPHRARAAAMRRAARVKEAIERTAGVPIRVGISSVTPDPRELPKCLEQANRALEWAVHKRRHQVLYVDEARRRAGAHSTFFDSLPALVRAVCDGERAVVARALEHLASEIVWQSGSIVVAARSYAEVLHSQVVSALERIAQLEPRTLHDLAADFGRALAEAPTPGAVTTAFRVHIAALADAHASSGAARRDRRLLRATRYIDDHVAEPLTLRQISKTAGYAPDYFTRLLRARHGRTFEQHLLGRRIARAKELLRSTSLTVAQVATASGFRTEAYFYRAFRLATGRSPGDHRQWARKPGIATSRRSRLRGGRKSSE